ncbi:MAG: hypothetical protein GY822_14895 [Deltaproteobacteria bacterium]|nr:hypothetical protein [Deltaproteobacteria bacterium]
MKRTGKPTWLLSCALALVAATSIGCRDRTPPATQEEEAPPPSPAVVVVVEEPDAQPPPGPDGEPAPDVVVPAEVDCAALPIDNGAGSTTIVDCYTALNIDNYCGNVYPENDVDAPDFTMVGACGTCDPSLFRAPAGASCFGDEFDPADPDDPFDPSYVPENNTCYYCHASAGYDGQHSIENPHPWSNITCAVCHGGNPASSNKVYSHVCPPPEVGNRQQQALDFRSFFLRFTTAGIQYLEDYECLQQNGEYATTKGTDWLAFINPGDLRSGEGIGCSKCHAEQNTNVSRSVMGTGTGMHSSTRHGVGIDNVFNDRRVSNQSTDWGSMADYASTAVTNPEYDPNNRVVGEVASLSRSPVIAGQNFLRNQTYNVNQIDNSQNVTDTNAQNYPNGMNNQVASDIFQEVLNQACTGCHLKSKYNNNRAGDYRSAGCSACHFETGVLGRTNSTDANLNHYEPTDPNNLTPGELVHATDHRIRNRAKLPTPDLPLAIQGIGDSNCLACHEGSNRTVQQYHGIRLDQGSHFNGNDDFDQVDQLGDLVNNLFFPSNNTVQFTNASELFSENQQFNNRFLTQWIKTEIWQNDVNDLVGGGGQDETPQDVHHKAGMGCIDCHGTGATHGRGKIFSRMKAATHENDVLCETCHGTIDSYAKNNGTQIIDQGEEALTNTIVNNAFTGEFWLSSRLNGSLHYIPQVKDIVNANNAGGGKQYPAGSQRAGFPLFDLVGSYAMGRYQANGGNLIDGYGPIQNNNANIQMQDNFSHSDGTAYAQGQEDSKNKGLECYTCHSAWQNNCVGCHLEPFYDENPDNYFFSQVTGERIYFNVNAFFLYQNPIDFMMGINDRGKISPLQGMHRWMNYTDLNNDTSNRYSYADRNGLGNDPQLRNGNRNNLPALQSQPYTPHSVRGRYSLQEIGMRGCLDCHMGNADNLRVTDQANGTYELQDFIEDEQDYANAQVYNVQMAMGRENTGLYQFDANGEPVLETNNAPAFDLMRVVEEDGTSNSSTNHPLLDPFDINPDYRQSADLNNALMTRPLSVTILSRLDQLNNVWGGLGNVYYYNAKPGTDPSEFANGGTAPYFINDYAYITQ